MTLIRKLSLRRLTRAIVALAARGGNKLMKTKGAERSSADRTRPFSHAIHTNGSHLRLTKRVTITVESERLLVVRRTGVNPTDSHKHQRLQIEGE